MTAAAPVQMVEQLSLDEYKVLFRHKYDTVSQFRKAVHKHMRVKRMQVLKYDITRKFSTKRYTAMTQGMIERYAQEAYNGAQRIAAINDQISAIERGDIQVSDLEKRVSEIGLTEQEAQRQLQAEEERKRLEVERLRIQAQEEQRLEQERYEAERQKTQERLNVDRIAQEQVLAHLKAGGQIKIEKDRIRYDETAITTRLESLFLDDIIGEIESESGGGFMARSKSMYARVLERWVDMTDYGQLHDVDWIASVVNARMQGYQYPSRMHHYTVPQYGPGKALTRTGIDTAITLDVSGSMLDNNRFEAAKRMTLALSAYMREMHPANQTYLSVFSETVLEVTNAQLYKEVKADGGTNTHLAINWLAQKIPEDRVSMAYLVTDGQSNYQGMAIEAVKQLHQMRPKTMLRIFLIDPTRDSRLLMRELGEAAGPKTKFLTVESQKLGADVIRQAADSISELMNLRDI